MQRGERLAGGLSSDRTVLEDVESVFARQTEEEPEVRAGCLRVTRDACARHRRHLRPPLEEIFQPVYEAILHKVEEVDLTLWNAHDELHFFSFASGGKPRAARARGYAAR